MKDLIIPKKCNTAYNIYDIDSDFLGLIICFKDNKEVGFIIYNNDDYGEWKYCIDISGCSDESDTSLNNLIKDLVDNNICTSFKVIDFD